MKKNIYANLPNEISEEIFETLVESKNIKIERIISHGQSSPEDYWYDQEENEWVILLKGNAKLQFKNGDIIELLPGEFINIPAHTKHRVEWTEPDVSTIWLAVFYKSEQV